MLLALLQSLPKIVSVVSLVLSMVNDRRQRGLGYKEAVADVLEQTHHDLAVADAERLQAQKDHIAHPSDDGGFNNEFRRD